MGEIRFTPWQRERLAQFRVSPKFVHESHGFNPKGLNAVFFYNPTCATSWPTKRLGFDLTPVADPGLCCGSAGAYSILQSALSRPMLPAKVDALEAGHPDLIATANIGCYAYLRQETRVPVAHWSSSRYDRRGLARISHHGSSRDR